MSKTNKLNAPPHRETLFYKYYRFDDGTGTYYSRVDKFLGRVKQKFQNFMFKLEKTPIKKLFLYGRYDFTKMYFWIRGIGTK